MGIIWCFRRAAPGTYSRVEIPSFFKEFCLDRRSCGISRLSRCVCQQSLLRVHLEMKKKFIFRFRCFETYYIVCSGFERTHSCLCDKARAVRLDTTRPQCTKKQSLLVVRISPITLGMCRAFHIILLETPHGATDTGGPVTPVSVLACVAIENLRTVRLYFLKYTERSPPESRSFRPRISWEISRLAHSQKRHHTTQFAEPRHFCLLVWRTEASVRSAHFYFWWCIC